MAQRPTRRAVLATAAALPMLAAGCKGVGALAPPPRPGPQVLALDAAIKAEAVLVAQYRAAAVALPGNPVVAAVLAEHAAHLRALRSWLILPPRLAAAGPWRVQSRPPLPSGQAAIVTALVAAERAASARLLRAMLTAPPPLAQVLASIAGSEAAHTVVLARGGRGIRPPSFPAFPAAGSGPVAGAARAGAGTVHALQAALAAEEAASYGYGYLGAHLDRRPGLFTEATGCWLAHQRARDMLQQLILAAGGHPVAAAAAYQLPLAVRTASQARALAGRLEAVAAAAYAALVAADERRYRRFAATELLQAALRSVRWTGHTAAFPGLGAGEVSSARGRRAPGRSG